MADDHELAVERTELARERTILAKERTFAAWIRTGLGAIAAGFAVVKLAEGADPAWLASAAGVAATLAGVALLLVGYGEYIHSVSALERAGLRHRSRRLVGVVTFTIAAAALLVVALFLR